MKYEWSTSEAWGKTGAVLLGSTALYLAFCVFCVTAVPAAQDVALALGILGGFPVWIGAMCYTVVARTAPRAWIVLIGAALLFSAGSLLSLT